MKHIVGFSGGIDSQTVAGIVLDKYGKDTLLLNSNAGENEDPLTNLFVDWYSVNVYPVIRCNAIVADLWKTPNYLEVAKAKDTKSAKAMRAAHDNQVPLTFTTMIRFKARPPNRTNQFCTEILKLRPQKRWIAVNVAAARQINPADKPEGFERNEEMKRQHLGFTRKAASAQIAKIPLPLSRHIARVYKP